jgi:hypothetical protein
MTFSFQREEKLILKNFSMDSSQSSLNDDPWIYIDENGTFLKKFGDQNAAGL